MEKNYDYLIVGAGLSGVISARKIAEEKNKKVLIIDRRDHIAGNCYDFNDEYGITVHKYGPHIFHSNYKEVWDYLSRFTDWIDYEHLVMAKLGEEYYHLPINIMTVNKLYGLDLNEANIGEFYEKVRVKKLKIKNSEDAILSKIGKDMYNKFFKYYTKKHWGVFASKLDRSVCERLPVRYNFDIRYFSDTYQGIPAEGYTAMVKKILDHENIDVLLNTGYKKIENKIKYNKLIYTGNIDEYFNYRYGRLPYRSLKFIFKSSKGDFQPCAQVNYTAALTPKFTRITEFKHFNRFKSDYTTIAEEYSLKRGEPYYPIPNKDNFKLYTKYKRLADAQKNFYCLGRLAEYRYLNMDQVSFNALKFVENIK